MIKGIGRNGEILISINLDKLESNKGERDSILDKVKQILVQSEEIGGVVSEKILSDAISKVHSNLMKQFDEKAVS